MALLYKRELTEALGREKAKKDGWETKLTWYS